MNDTNDLPFILVNSALEIDHYNQGIKNNFGYTNKFLKILEENQLTDDPNPPYSSFPHLVLWREFRKNEKNKDMRYSPELALEMKLFTMDLRNIENLPKERAKEFIPILCNLSRGFIANECRYSRKNFFSCLIFILKE